MDREKRLGWYFAHAKGDLNMRMLRRFEGTVYVQSDFHVWHGQFYRHIREIGY